MDHPAIPGTHRRNRPVLRVGVNLNGRARPIAHSPQFRLGRIARPRLLSELNHAGRVFLPVHPVPKNDVRGICGRRLRPMGTGNAAPHIPRSNPAINSPFSSKSSKPGSTASFIRKSISGNPERENTCGIYCLCEANETYLSKMRLEHHSSLVAERRQRCHPELVPVRSFPLPQLRKAILSLFPRRPAGPRPIRRGRFHQA